jgi:hypothetical protein
VLTKLSPRRGLVGSDVQLDATFNECTIEHILGDLKQKGTLGNSRAVSWLAEGNNVSGILYIYVAIEPASLAASVMVNGVAPGLLPIGTVDERTWSSMGVDRTSSCDRQNATGGKWIGRRYDRWGREDHAK